MKQYYTPDAYIELLEQEDIFTISEDGIADASSNTSSLTDEDF